jgi:NADPH:quinone reductase-like Zn-dependent oxidoreductase
MKAAQISEYGDASVVQINEVPQPQPTAEQVLVQVHAASLNPFDTMVRSGALKDSMPLPLPMTLGGDIAGTVVAVGADVTGFAVGDQVFGQAIVVAGNSGAFAEFAATKATQIAIMPKGYAFTEVAALPLVGSSAVQALVHHLGLQAGQKLFIHGGAGGIGSLAIQIAKHIGAYVATTATGDNIAFVRQLGADEVIDYATEDFAQTLHDYDAVFDTVGGQDFAKALTILKPGGVAVSMIAQPDQAQAQQLGVKAMMQSTQVTTEILTELRELVESGVVGPQVSQVFPLEEIQQAFTAREHGSGRGKIVIKIAAD